MNPNTDPVPLPTDMSWPLSQLAEMNLSSLESTLNTNYTFSLTQMAALVGPDFDPSHPGFEDRDLPDVSPQPRYASLDCERSDFDLILPLSKSRSFTGDAIENAKERRRTQNRFAQRAYRQRKEQAIKDQEKEIEMLKLQLEKEKKLNQALAKVIEFLKERLKSKNTSDDKA